MAESQRSRRNEHVKTCFICIADVETQSQYNQNEGSLPRSVIIDNDVMDAVDTPQIEMEAPEVASHPELTSEYLQALGDAVDEVPQYGEEIHSNLAQRWLPLLRKGLPKDTRDLIFKPYIIPSNCKLLKAPSLNAEISAAITESLKTRDKKLENYQQQLGIGITAINRALTLLLTGGDQIQSIKILSDASRILCDLHYLNTETRIKLLTPSLDKSLLNVIDNNHDETLFGANLSEKIKAAKIIEKQGLSIKKNVPVTKPSTSSLRPRPGNWTGPPRFLSNRGGRTAPRTGTMTSTARRTLAGNTPLPPSQPRFNQTNRQRAYPTHRR